MASTAPAGGGKDQPIVWMETTPDGHLPFEAPGRAIAVSVPLPDSDEDRLSSLLKSSPDIESVLLESSPADVSPENEARWKFRLKKATALARGVRPDVRIALSAAPGAGGWPALAAGALADEILAANVDAVAVSSGDAAQAGAVGKPVWIVEREAGPVVAALDRLARARDERCFWRGPEPGPDSPVLARLQAALTESVSADPAPPNVRAAGGSAFRAGFYDGKLLAPLVLVGGDAREAHLDLPKSGPFRRAEVENLETGARRTFDLPPGARALTLDLSRGLLLVRFVSARAEAEQTRARVEVGGVHELTAEEIVAKERAWHAAQNDRVRSFSAQLMTSLRFRVADVNETFDLTIKGPLYKERGREFDWVWEEFFVNGVKWKGKTLPKIPILQPEKVTTLPLEIELDENYSYSRAGRTLVEGHDVYEIDFAPKSTVEGRPVFRGRVWIDARTFALVKRRSVQEGLKGETLSNIETEYYRPVKGDPGTVLPTLIEGHEIFSTAGRTTDVERKVEMTAVRVNPEDLEARRREAYASPSQIVRDTVRGLKYLVPDPQHPGERIVEERISKSGLFGAAGFFYDGSVSYPIPLLGAQYFNFDLFEKGKQVSLFFGGVLLTGNFTNPAFLGTRFDVGADVFAIAIPTGDVSYRDGREVKNERLKHVPAFFQLNVGHPLGPYVKATVSAITKYDNYQRDPDTAPDFVTPADTMTLGGSAKLTTHVQGFDFSTEYSIFRRQDWPFWGIPATSEYRASNRRYETFTAGLEKDYYFSGFRKIHFGVKYLSGTGLDRFSRFEFGGFSGSPIRGFKSGSLRTSQAWVANLSYGLNIENLIRLEVLYDQAILNDRVSGFNHAYYSGAGVSGQLNGPWNNSLIRFDVGVPVVSHGIHGVTATALILKMF